MESLHDICCGIDLHKDMLQACVLAGTEDGEIHSSLRKFGCQYDDLNALAQWLQDLNCPIVAMESTGVYWQPTHRRLTDAGIECCVVNARHIRNIPGRKTDINDAQWIAQALRYGLVRKSFVPCREIQELRQYTRTHTTLIHQRSDNVNRIEKLLQEQGFKLSSVVSSITSLTGRRILDHLAKYGSISLEKVQEYRVSFCHKDPQTIFLALQGTMSPNISQLLSHWLALYDDDSHKIEQLESMILELVKPFQGYIDILDSIPGVALASAISIIGEIGIDMSCFPTSEHLASWAGLSPGNNESAGKKKSTRILHGNSYLKRVLNQCAWACSHVRDSPYSSWYWRLKKRVGTKKAIVALSRKLLTLCYALLTSGSFFDPAYNK